MPIARFAARLFVRLAGALLIVFAASGVARADELPPLGPTPTSGGVSCFVVDAADHTATFEKGSFYVSKNTFSNPYRVIINAVKGYGQTVKGLDNYYKCETAKAANDVAVKIGIQTKREILWYYWPAVHVIGVEGYELSVADPDSENQPAQPAPAPAPAPNAP